MNASILSGYREYRRQKERRRMFADSAGSLAEILESPAWSSDLVSPEFSAPERRALLAIAPLIEIAWADGRVTRREMDTIIEAAEIYGLIDSETGYRELMDQLMSRPAPPAVGAMWQRMRRFVGYLDHDQRGELVRALRAQAEFVAEQSSESLIAFLSGERVSADESEALAFVVKQLDGALEATDAENYRRAFGAGTGRTGTRSYETHRIDTAGVMY